MDSRRNFIGKVATGLAGTLAAGPAEVLGAADRIRVGDHRSGRPWHGTGQPDSRLPQHRNRRLRRHLLARLERAQAAVPGSAGSHRLSPSARRHIARRRRHRDPAASACRAVHRRARCRQARLSRKDSWPLRVDHAKRMRATYQKYGSKRTVQIGHQACSFGHVSDVRQFLADPDRMGKITAIAMQMHRNTPRQQAAMVADGAAHSGPEPSKMSRGRIFWAKLACLSIRIASSTGAISGRPPAATSSKA